MERTFLIVFNRLPWSDPGALEMTDEDYFDHLFRSVRLYDPDEDVGLPGGRQRKHLEMLPPETRKYVFDEIQKGLSTPDAMAEAGRCLRCHSIATVAVLSG